MKNAYMYGVLLIVALPFENKRLIFMIDGKMG